jgi:hypothetical protein
LMSFLSPRSISPKPRHHSLATQSICPFSPHDQMPVSLASRASTGLTIM